MSIRYTLRRLTQSNIEGEKFKDNLKDYELAVVKPSGRLVIRLGDNLYDLVNAADNGEIEAIGRAWAVSEQSPDGESDQESPTHQTMSSRSWALTAKDWANKTGSAVSGGEYSAKHYAIIAGCSASNANISETNALSYKNTAQTAANTAKDWANKMDSVVSDGEYSAKYYAINAQTSSNTAKDWANKTGSAVAGGEYSAKYYANAAACSASSVAESIETINNQLEQSTELLDHLYEITDADEVSY